MRTVGGTLHENACDACVALGLCVDDELPRRTLEEAVITKMPRHIMRLFVDLMTNTGCRPVESFDTFKAEMIAAPGIPDENAVLLRIKHLMESRGCSFSATGLLDPGDSFDFDLSLQDSVGGDGGDGDDDDHGSAFSMNVDQQACVDALMHAKSGVFMLSAPGGTGKTVVCKRDHVPVSGEGGDC